ncbi:MAG TPA: transglycosylase domain-containing protein, partial [Polyangiaceae bacterium]|nr:transglycosylase domain-containing protein [Polyangiaceae bacterium]
MVQAPQTTLRPDPKPSTPAGRRESGSGSRKLPARPWRRRMLRVLIWLFSLGSLAGVLGLIAAFLVVQHYAQGLPSVEVLKAGYEPPQVTRILARDGSVLSSVFKERRTVVPFKDIPDGTKLAFLAAEDAHFYEHEGLNYLGILRAVWADLRTGRRGQGGSTITQQVVRNILLDDRARTYSRKIREMILSRRLENELSKDEILGLYLNEIPLGHGRYGVEEAARYYFGKHVSELDVGESALLAGIVPNPTHYTPRRSPQKALARRQYVLSQMRDKGFITEAYFAQLYASPLPKLAPEEQSQSGLAPEAVEVAKEALAKAEQEHPSQGGYSVTTTINPELETAARHAVRKALHDYADRHSLWPPYESKRVKAWGKPFSGKPSINRVYVGVVQSGDDATGQLLVQVGDTLGHVNLSEEERFNPEHLPPSQFAISGALLRVRTLEAADTEGGPRLKLELGPEAALVAIDVRTREVLALVGSEEGFPGGLDRARRARRQPGSSFKAIIYS